MIIKKKKKLYFVTCKFPVFMSHHSKMPALASASKFLPEVILKFKARESYLRTSVATGSKNTNANLRLRLLSFSAHWTFNKHLTFISLFKLPKPWFILQNNPAQQNLQKGTEESLSQLTFLELSHSSTCHHGNENSFLFKLRLRRRTQKRRRTKRDSLGYFDTSKSSIT